MWSLITIMGTAMTCSPLGYGEIFLALAFVIIGLATTN